MRNYYHDTPLLRLTMFRRVAYFMLLFGVAIWLMVACSAPATLPPPTPPTGPTIEIGLLTPNSGEMTTFGRWLQNGIIMALEEWNEQGGLQGQRIVWRMYDSQCDFVSASEATKQAVADGMTLLIGPLCTEAAIGAATVADAHGVLMLTPTATHPLVTVDGQGQTRPTIFRAAADHQWMGRQSAQFAVDQLHSQRVALWHVIGEDDGAYMTTAFADKFEEMGGMVAYHAAINPAEIADHITAILTAEVDLLYLPTDPHLAVQVAEAMPPNSGITLLGGPRWDTPELNHSQLAGNYFTTPYAPTPQVAAWAEQYKALYAIEPETLAFLGYEAAQLLRQASEQAGTVDPTALATMLETGVFHGLTGPIQFDTQHNPQRPVPVLHIEPEGATLVEMVGGE